MILFKLERNQVLPISIENAWDYFVNPANLTEITPPHLSLRIQGDMYTKIHSGMMIEYTVKPLWGIEMPWVSEIKHVREPYFFVDEQRVGPYTFWYHQHHFLALGKNAVEIVDRIYYALPLGAFAHVLDRCLIRRKLDNIFSYRRRILEQKFITQR